MPERLVRITDSEVGRFIQADRALNDRKKEYMNAIADRVVEGGGFCDEPTFLQIFFGNINMQRDGARTRRYDRSALPPLVQERLKIADDMNYALGEPFARFYTPEGSAGITTVGLVMGSERDVKSPVVEYRLNRRKYSYIGNIMLTTLVLVDSGGLYTYERPEADWISLLRLERDFERFDTSITERSTITDAAVGMPAIRRAIRGNDRFEYAGMAHRVEERVQRLRQYAGEAVLTPPNF